VDAKSLQTRIVELFQNPPPPGYEKVHFALFEEFRAALNAGEVRAAQPAEGEWRVNAWVKQGILLGFRMGVVREFAAGGDLQSFDKHTLPPRRLTAGSAVRIVPGGSSIRDGAFIGRGVTCMPPMFVNIGAYVDDGTMIDSHALVGSCAQVGKRVHLSAAAQIGGVLEPVGALPVVIEDDVLVGGNCGVYEGTIVREGAVLGAGTILTGGTPVYDVVRQTTYRRNGDKPLEIPSRAVVVPGSRAITHPWGRETGLSLYTPVIVKYRDSRTDASSQLEDLLR
jgi:2,3,4,5-tetrahydropyridine-2,6-dicarboxylate N-succinyltransferase